MKKALIFQGGWKGHTPKKVAQLFASVLEKVDFNVHIVDSLDPLEDIAALKRYDLIIPIWTMGEISDAQFTGLNEAVKSGVGLGGIHGGMCDAFRGRIEYNWMTGGQFLGHPHVGEFKVNFTNIKSPITAGMKPFKYDSEQYYVAVDPANTVLATTVYHFDKLKVTVPVVWTKNWGLGRVFYSSLGHTADELKKYPDVVAMTIRGLCWAAEGKKCCEGAHD